MKKKKPLFLLLLVGCLIALGCGDVASTKPTMPSESASPQPSRAGQRKGQPTPNATGKVIWSGESGGVSIRWTTADLFAGDDKVLAPFATKKFKEFAADQVEDDLPGEETQVMRCEYHNDFKVLSVVGTLVSLEDQTSFSCERAKGEGATRFTTVDLAKPGEVMYASGEEASGTDVDPAQPGKIVKLTDYFAEQDILRALLADPIIRKAVAGSKTSASPQTLAALPELFAKDDYRLGSTDFQLRPDFLTRFVFHHVEGDKVAVRLGLPPHFGFNHAQHEQLGLLLPIPSLLQQPLALAAARQEGFLMMDAPKVAQGQSTKFSFRTGKGNGE